MLVKGITAPGSSDTFCRAKEGVLAPLGGTGCRHPLSRAGWRHGKVWAITDQGQQKVELHTGGDLVHTITNHLKMNEPMA